jgi:hypothetical protein
MKSLSPIEEEVDLAINYTLPQISLDIDQCDHLLLMSVCVMNAEMGTICGIAVPRLFMASGIPRQLGSGGLSGSHS